MRQPSLVPVVSAANASPAPTGGARWRALRPPLARSFWLALVVGMLTITLGSLPTYQSRIRLPCTPARCDYQQLTAAQLATLNHIGITLESYVAISTALLLAGIAISLAVSALIIWRRAGNGVAALVAMMLVVSGTGTPASSVAGAPAGNPWVAPNIALLFLNTALLIFVLLLFPSGRFAPRWMRWFALVFFMVFALTPFLPSGALIAGASVSHLGWLIVVSGFAMAALSQVYRYRRERSVVLRQQTKWVAFGLSVPIIFIALLNIFALNPAFGANNALYLLLANEIGFLFPLAFSLAFGAAILRSRLWDIDILINRALVYGSLTGILAAVYVGLIIGLQTLLSGFIGRDNSVAIVVSTLVIWALFNPSRRGIQAVIDRRFYRRKYDAAKTLAAFAASLREQVDVDALRAHVVGVVEETMHPAHVSLWLRVPEQHVSAGTEHPVDV